jgi:hypothetical protein
MRIRNQAGSLAVSLGLALVAVGPAFAKHSQVINVDHDVTIKGKQLDAGKYRVSWDGQGPDATVTFTHKESVITTTGTLVQRPLKSRYDAVVYTEGDNGASTILEVRFAGSNKVLSFDNSSTAGNQTTPDKKSGSAQ